MKTVRLALCAAVCIGAMAEPCFGGLWFRGTETENGRIGYWDDINYWWVWKDYTTKATSFDGTPDCNFPYGGLALITNKVSRAWNMALGSRMTDSYAAVRVENGGSIVLADKVTVGCNNGWDNVPGRGLLDVRPGGVVDGALYVGSTGEGIVTNAGKISIGNMVVGNAAGSRGTYVHDGGENNLPNAKDLVVGQNGTGDIIVKSGTFNWYWYWYQTQMIGFMNVGSGTGGHGTITVESGATFQAGPLYLGGCTNACGYGKVALKGGTIVSDSTIGTVGMDNLWLGAATNDIGSVRGDSYGEVRGWGNFNGNTGDGADTQPKSICARLGNGAIIADGEGVERTLDCSTWWQVTNVLFGCAVTTNGWYAVNKGAVLLPIVNVVVDHGGDNWQCGGGTNSVGCARGLAVPDLVGAVRISSFKSGWQGNGWCTAVMVLAEDRTDAHLAQLPAKYRPLGFWKAGTFGERNTKQPRNFSVTEASHPRMSFRYDSRKVSKADSHLVVLRWSETDQKWERLSKTKTMPEVPIAHADVRSLSGDANWTLGTFCVAEQPQTGMVMVLQ